jgi:hypothetical protein
VFNVHVSVLPRLAVPPFASSIFAPDCGAFGAAISTAAADPARTRRRAPVASVAGFR